MASFTATRCIFYLWQIKRNPENPDNQVFYLLCSPSVAKYCFNKPQTIWFEVNIYKTNIPACVATAATFSFNSFEYI